MTREEKFNGLLTELKLYFYTDRFEFILNELEEEINSVCEWKMNVLLPGDYCPYCGRKIKVIK